jgi:predicted site-specific integrase-resolvase
MGTPSSHYTTGEVADLCRSTPKTIIKWIKAGHLTAAVSPTGRYLVEARTLLAFLRKHNYHVPPPLWTLAEDAP